MTEEMLEALMELVEARIDEKIHEYNAPPSYGSSTTESERLKEHFIKKFIKGYKEST